MAAAKEIHDTEDPGAVDKRTVQNWLRCFKKGGTSLEDRQNSGRSSVVEDEALIEMVEQQPNASTRTLSAELGPSQSTINRLLHRLGLVNRCCREAPHEITNDQVQRRVNICKQLLANPRLTRFWHRIATENEKWSYFHNPNKRNEWLRSGQLSNLLSNKSSLNRSC
ncbi:histone-lysine N-methyltransferase SETMAR-like [Octopus bimaculoides]|uniref:histone-lysine N-methyltransferase SETMAR-like n=1 Tax=Octopus bimaculoides TaxID=37653 RepID=UPI00071E41AD|nr:histone-lysine N-methyltransferase SETMAR-like [Octopus bimaculoides]|eukprot:XP_014783721.1 PREDICTED: histone-lysine N-methyltransferase SETMAR-like [Octopus bimaculoides]